MIKGVIFCLKKIAKKSFSYHTGSSIASDISETFAVQNWSCSLICGFFSIEVNYLRFYTIWFPALRTLVVTWEILVKKHVKNRKNHSFYYQILNYSDLFLRHFQTNWAKRTSLLLNWRFFQADSKYQQISLNKLIVDIWLFYPLQTLLLVNFQPYLSKKHGNAQYYFFGFTTVGN